MSLENVIRELEAYRQKLEVAANVLSGKEDATALVQSNIAARDENVWPGTHVELVDAAHVPRSVPTHKKHWTATPAQRALMSRRMKASWKARRIAKARLAQ